MTSNSSHGGGGAGARAVVFLGLALVLGAPACTTSDPDAGDDEWVAAEAELLTRGIQSIRIELGTSMSPEPHPGGCVRSGYWTFAFDERRLSGEACIESMPRVVGSTLSEADSERVRKVLSRVRTTARPKECPTDMPVSRLHVLRATSQVSYVDARAACGDAATPVREATLAELVSLLEELSAPSSLPSCRRTGCSGNVCADSDRITRCDWRPEYACYGTALCERDASGQCGFRQTPELLDCLASR